MSNLSVRQRDSSRARLSAVQSLVPSAEPDTTAVDESWAEEADEFGHRPRHSFIALKAEPRAVGEARRSLLPSAPALAHDVWESPHALVVLVDLPGVEPRHLSLSLGSHALHLEVSVPSNGEPRLGVAGGQYEVRFEVPVGAGPDSIDAALRHGVLRIRISKENAGTRRVPIISNDTCDELLED